MKKLTLANALTCFRLLGGIALAFVEPLTLAFYILYTLCGISDALDGPVARHSASDSEFGARLDSVADLTFYTVALVRLLPILYAVLPGWVWWWTGGILALRLLAYAVAAVKFRRFSALHTWASKATSIALFAVPYLIHTRFFLAWCILLLSVASFAGLEELALHLMSREYKPNERAGRKPRHREG